MPERAFLTETWDDDWFQELDRNQRYLFIYLWTNNHVNQAGVYHLTLTTMAFETKFSKDQLKELLPSLSPKLEWYPEENYIWVRNFLKFQAKSPKFVVAALRYISNSSVPEDLRAEFQLYNQNLLRGVAPSQHISLTKRECVLIRDAFRCQYCGKEIDEAVDYEMDHIIPVTRGGKDNYLNLVASCRSCNQQKLDKTPSEAGMKEPKAATFHGAQATYILRNDPTLQGKWLQVFPERADVIDSILGNINQHYSTLNNIDAGYSSDLICSGSRSNASAGDKGMGVVKGEGESGGQQISPSESEIEESLSAGDREIILVWCSVKGFSMPPSDASELVIRLRTEFPDLDILAESKKWAARKLTEPLTKNSRPSAQIWNWMCKAREFARGEKKGEQAKVKRLAGARPASDFRGKW